jgi:hypothetical protein
MARTLTTVASLAWLVILVARAETPSPVLPSLTADRARDRAANPLAAVGQSLTGFVLPLEIKLDLDVIGIAQKNLQRALPMLSRCVVAGHTHAAKSTLILLLNFNSLSPVFGLWVDHCLM